MTENPLYAIGALFDTPDAVVHAAGEIAEAGYREYDVNTPYPVHGMDRKMRLRTSRLGYYALGFGILGTSAAMGLMSWVSLVDYPLVIGGKPFWSWPAFVPVAFELTVLLASVLSVAAMIVIYFKFPNTSHPLHDTSYMKRVSSDRFGIYIKATDPLFDEQKVRDRFRQLGAGEIIPIRWDLEGRAHRPPLFEPKFLGVLAATAAVVMAATYVIFNHLLFLPPFDWMSAQPKLKAQQASALFADGIGMRQPVEGTVARGHLPYPYRGKPEEAARMLRNPLPTTAAVLDRGGKKYLTYCSPCHGNFGEGDSRLRGQFPNPPTLHSDKVRTWPDGAVFHVITEGQNVMPSYAAQIPEDDRWAIIHYLRVLQRAHHAKESDLQ